MGKGSHVARLDIGGGGGGGGGGGEKNSCAIWQAQPEFSDGKCDRNPLQVDPFLKFI